MIAPRQLAGYQNQLNSKSRKKDQDQWTIKQTRRSSETAKINRIDKKASKKRKTTRLPMEPKYQQDNIKS